MKEIDIDNFSSEIFDITEDSKYRSIINIYFYKSILSLLYKNIYGTAKFRYRFQ